MLRIALISAAIATCANVARADGLAFSAGAGFGYPGQELASDERRGGFFLTAGYGFSSIDADKLLTFRGRWRHLSGEQDSFSVEAHATFGPAAGIGPYAGASVGYGLWNGCLRGAACDGEGFTFGAEVGAALPLGHGRMALVGVEAGVQYGLASGVDRVFLPSALVGFTF